MFVLWNRTWGCMSGGVLVFMYLTFTHMPSESNCRWLVSFVVSVWCLSSANDLPCVLITFCTRDFLFIFVLLGPQKVQWNLWITCSRHVKPGLAWMDHTFLFTMGPVCLYTPALIVSSCLCPQLQLWLENPKIQLTLENSLAQIEPPYNSTYSTVLCTTAALLLTPVPSLAWRSSGEWLNISCQPLAKAKRVKPVFSCSK